MGNLLGYDEFVQIFAKVDASQKESQFGKFRLDYPSLGNYVLAHAHAVYQTGAYLWGTPEAFVVNYIQTVERWTSDVDHDNTAKVQRWVLFARMVRSLMIGS